MRVDASSAIRKYQSRYLFVVGVGIYRICYTHFQGDMYARAYPYVDTWQLVYKIGRRNLISKLMTLLLITQSQETATKSTCISRNITITYVCVYQLICGDLQSAITVYVGPAVLVMPTCLIVFVVVSFIFQFCSRS